MPSLVLEGATLGQKHEHYNYIVRSATADETYQLESVNHDESDVDNLLRIDVACGRRDVDYVLEVLRGGDPLYSALALRRSAWLITDDAYAHIVNPHFLHRELFPKINTKVKHKLLQAIRLNLKNEARVDEFYNFFKDDFEFAQKWLPRCSDALILSVLEKDATKIHVNLLKRLCRKSVAILKTCCEICPSPHWLKNGKIFLYSHTEAYLELVSSAEVNKIPKFGKKSTRLLMDTYPDIIFEQFHRYCYKIDLPEFAKYFSSIEAIRDFILKQRESDHYEARTWCKHRHLKYLIRQIPEDQRYRFVREIIIDKRKDFVSNGSNSHEEENSGNIDLYPWYRYFPFETVFSELKDVVFGRTSAKNESDFGTFGLLEPIGCSNIQTWILKIMIRAARGNSHHIQTLLRHYQDNHVIEPYDDPISSLLCKITKTHKYDETTWNMLNDIFCSMGIYREDRNIIVPCCIQAIILYNILHDIQIPKVIEQKIKLLNFRSLPQKLEPDESDKVFAYLYNYASKEIFNKEIKNKADLKVTLSKCGELVRFLQDWKRNVAEFPVALNKIKELIKIKDESTWATDSEVHKVFCRFYKEHKRLRIHLFQESLFLCLSDETCLNALKHDPDLFSRHKSWIEAITSTESVSLRRTLLKLRIYWPRSETKPWVDGYLSALKWPTVNRVCVEGLFILVPSKEALSLVDKHISVVTEIDGKVANDSLLLNIARYMRLLRPSVSLDTVWSYLERNAGRHAAQFLGHIVVNSCHAEAAPFATKLLSITGPLQKLGIRYMLSQCDAHESKQVILDVWNSNNSSSVKRGLFKYIYKHLLKEKRTIEVENAWENLSIIIDNLTPEFYETLKDKIDNIEKVNESVRLNFFMKCYLCILPQLLTNDEYMIKWYMSCNVKHFDVSFVENLLLNTLDQFFVKDHDVHYTVKNQRTDTLRFLTAYLTSNDGIESQQIKFKKLCVPLMDCFVKVWPTEGYKEIFRRFLESLSLNVSKRLKKQFVIPTNLYKNIQTCMNNEFSLEKDYYLITFWNISVIFVEILDNGSKSDLYDIFFDKMKSNYYYFYRYEVPEFEELLSHIVPSFAQASSKYFKQDKMLSQCPGLYPLASKSLMNAFISLSFPYKVMYKTLKYMLVDEKSEILYSVAIGVIRCMFLNSGCGEYRYFVDEELKNIILSHPSRVIRANYHYSNLPYSINYNEEHNTHWKRSGFMKTYGPNDMNVY